MARTQGVKRARADSPVSLGLANQTEETVDNAPPPAKRAARSSKGKAVADHDGSDYDCLGEDLEEEELAPEEIQALAIKGELVDFEEDSDDGDSESTWDEWDNELAEDESSPQPLEVDANEVLDEANIQRFWARIRYIIVTLQNLARSISGDVFWNRQEVSDRQPITRGWWIFLCKVDLEYLVELYLSAIPQHVQSILGQEVFTHTDLLKLVGNWMDPSWGVYLDVLSNGLRYVGSATKKGTLDKGSSTMGLWNRISTYFRWVRRRLLPQYQERIAKDGGAHGKAILDPNVTIQFVILARFSNDTCKTYILFLETLMMIYLQTFNSGITSTYAPLESYKWAQTCTPVDLLDKDLENGLNRCWTLNQGLGSSRKKDRICSHCARGSIGDWYHSDPTKPFVKMLCQSCYRNRRDHGGVLQDAQHIINRCKAIALSKKKKLDNDWNCDGCFNMLKDLKTHKYVENKGEGLIFCRSCCYSLGFTEKKTSNKSNKGTGTPHRSVPGSANKTQQPGYVNPQKHVPGSGHQCVSCGTEKRPTKADVNVDNKFHCYVCRYQLKKLLENFSKPIQPLRGRQYRDAAAAMAHYCRNEAPSPLS